MAEPEGAKGGSSRGTLGLLSPGLGEPRQAPALRAAGWRVLWTPVLEIAPLAQLPPQTLQTLTSPPPDAWLLLASPSAAAVLLQMVPARQLQAWEGRVAAVGESTAAPLREAGLQVRCPPGQGAGGAQAALEEVLLPQGARHCVLATGHAPRGQLQHRARQAGIACTLAQLYRRIPRRPDPRQLRETLLGDWILATDTNSLRRLHRLAEESSVLPQAGVLTPWPRVAALATQLGWPQARQLPDLREDSLLRALQEPRGGTSPAG